MPRVILWASHRCASTVFERSIRELDTVKVMHEPHCMTYFADVGSIRDNADSLFEAKREQILSLTRPTESYQHAFIKDLAYYVAGRYEEYTSGEFFQFKHTFLIRHPKAIAESFQKVVNSFGNEKVPFYTDTLGFEEMDKMYETVKRDIDKKPTVICAEDLLSKPRSI